MSGFLVNNAEETDIQYDKFLKIKMDLNVIA